MTKPHNKCGFAGNFAELHSGQLTSTYTPPGKARGSSSTAPVRPLMTTSWLIPPTGGTARNTSANPSPVMSPALTRAAFGVGMGCALRKNPGCGAGVLVGTNILKVKAPVCGENAFT